MTQYSTDSAPQTFCGYAVEEVLIGNKLETKLFRLFDELGGLVLDRLPGSLLISPAVCIQQVCREEFGVFLTVQEIYDAYLRYETTLTVGGSCYV